MVELISLVILAGAALYIYRDVKNNGKQEIQLDNAEAHIDAVEEATKKARKREKEIAALSLADKRKRLSK